MLPYASLLCPVAVAAALSVAAAAPEGGIYLGGGFMEGTTTYRIGGRFTTAEGESGVERFPLSELDFPLDVLMLHAGGAVDLGDDWRLNGRIGLSLTGEAGTTTDSDWGVYYIDTLDIYSESDAELDALTFEIALHYRFARAGDWTFTAGIGYLHEAFDYDVVGLDEWSPSHPELPHEIVSGSVSSYELTYRIPYAELGARYDAGDGLGIEATLGFSPFVDAEDEDSRVLRPLVARGDGEGDAVLGAMAIEYGFGEAWFLAGAIEFLVLKTDGHSKVAIQGAYSHTIRQENESNQTVGTIALGRRL